MFVDIREIDFCEDSLNVPKMEESPRHYFKIVGDYTREGFARNYGGHPRSDVAVIDEQNNLQGLDKIFARLNEHSGDGFSSDVPDSEIALMHRSKYCQTASEMIRYYENLLEVRDQRELEKLEGSEKERRAKELADRRELLKSSLTADEKEEIRKRKRSKELDELVE